MFVVFFFIQVSSWSAWGSCSAPPGRCSTNSGTRKRTRRVTLSPSCGGSSCPTLTHTSQCTPVPIPCKVILIIFFLFLHICCLLRYVQKCTHWHLIWTITTFWISPALWWFLQKIANFAIIAIFAKVASLQGGGTFIAIIASAQAIFAKIAIFAKSPASKRPLLASNPNRQRLAIFRHFRHCMYFWT